MSSCWRERANAPSIRLLLKGRSDKGEDQTTKTKATDGESRSHIETDSVSQAARKLFSSKLHRVAAVSPTVSSLLVGRNGERSHSSRLDTGAQTHVGAGRHG